MLPTHRIPWDLIEDLNAAGNLLGSAQAFVDAPKQGLHVLCRRSVIGSQDHKRLGSFLSTAAFAFSLVSAAMETEPYLRTV